MMIIVILYRVGRDLVTDPSAGEGPPLHSHNQKCHKLTQYGKLNLFHFHYIAKGPSQIKKQTKRWYMYQKRGGGSGTQNVPSFFYFFL